MKKKFTIGLIALLSVSFIFFSCGDSGSGGGSGYSAAEIAAQELGDNLAALIGDPSKVAVSGTTVTVSASFTIDAAIPEDIVIETGVILVLGENVTLTTEKDITVNGAVTLETGASVVGDTALKVIIGTGATVTGGENFYTAAEVQITEPVTAGTYDWDANAGGPSEAGWKAQLPPPSATVASVTITGTAGDVFAEPVNVVITILNDTLVSKITANDNLAAWITNLPVGLTAVAQADAEADTASVIIAVDGTPASPLAAPLTIVIPAASLTISGTDLTVTANAEAKFAIAAPVGPDVTPPVPGNSGALATDNVAATSFDVTWTKASDTVSLEAALVYSVYYKTGTDFTDNEVETIKTGTAGNTDTDVDTLSITGLTGSTTYYFAVIVEDEAGNEAAYAKASETTAAPPDVTPPVPGNSGTLATDNVAATSFDVTWTKADDTVSLEAALVYSVYYKTGTDFTDNEVETIKTGTAGNIDTDVDTLSITGLNPATTYYFAVIVADEAGNEAAYDKASETTLSLAAEAKATLEAAGLNSVTVTNTTTVTLTEPGTITTSVAVPAEVTLDLSTFSLTLGSSAVLTIAAPANITGSGAIIATGGTITIGEVEEYATDGGGIVANNLATALTAFTADAVVLKTYISLGGDFGADGENVIGTVAAIDDSTPTAVTDDVDGGTGTSIEITSGTTFEGTLNNPSVTGTDSGGFSGTITLSVDGTLLKIVDGDYSSNQAVHVILTFDSLQLKNSGLIAPDTIEFSIGLLTQR
jgi:hypothetical protein